MGTPRRSVFVGMGTAIAVLASPLTAEPQTAETFKSGGPVPYGEYLKRTGQSAPAPARRVHAVVHPAGPHASAQAPTKPDPASRTTAPGAPRAPLVTIATPAPPGTSTPRPKAVPIVAPAPAPAPVMPPQAPRPRSLEPPPPPALPPPAATAPALSTPAGARLPPSDAIPAAELEAFVDGGVRQAMASGAMAGVAVVVVQDGQPVLEKGYGLARLSPAVPVDPGRTLFRLGSISKVLTWIEVLKQVDAGRLSLDAPIDDALPADMKLGQEGFGEPARLHHLMTHTAGFETRELGRLFKVDPARLQGLGGALKRERSRRVREAGRLTSYSNYGAAVAGAAAAAVAKAPFDQLIEDDLLKPAGLTSTTFREPYPEDQGLPEPMPKALGDRLADGFRSADGGLKVQPFAYGQDFAPAVSASSTPHDMGRLMSFLLGAPGAPWSPKVTAALFTPLASPTPGVPGWTSGLQQEPLPGGFAGFGHGGATPAFHSRMLLAPQLRLGIFVVANSDGGQALVDRLPAAIAARFYGPPPAVVGRPDPAIDAERYAGLYLTTRRAYHGLEGMVDRLARSERVGVDPEGRLVVRDPDGSARSFLPTAHDHFTSADGARTLAFVDDPKRPEAHLRVMIDPERAEGAVREDWLHAPTTLAGATIIAVGAALLCLSGLALRDWREFRQTRGQAAASAVQAVAAGAWIGAVAAFLVFCHGARDPAALMYDWPNPWLVGASWAAVAASLLGLVQLVQLRQVWTGARRLQGWNAGRRIGHTLTSLLFLAYSVLLAAWGALEPWSS